MSVVKEKIGSTKEGSVTLGKMIDDNTFKGDAGIAVIHRRVSQMKQVWHERAIDPGIDGSIEMRNPATGEMSNRHIYVQSKASDRFPGETDTKFHFPCKPRDIDYWMKAGENPVILVCSHPETGEAWWVHIQSWFADLAHRASGRVDFDKATQRFDKNSAPKLFALVDPHGSAHTPVAIHRDERLISNLLPVEFPDTYYTAQTTLTSKGSVYGAQRKSTHEMREDFVLSRGRIYAWSPIAGTALTKATDTADKANPIGELLNGSDDDRRLCVQLLGAALQHDLRDTCSWHQGRKFIHYNATGDLSDRQVLSASGRGRIAFKGFYERKDNPSLKQFYRHAALKVNFIDVEGGWFCQLRPDYFFTSDGYRESPFADEYLTGLKKRERSPGVLGELRLWVGLLKGDAEPTLLQQEGADRILTFEDLLTFTTDRGIDDRDWQPPGGDSKDPADQMALDFEDFE